jgi:hypothetical protein
MTGTRKIAAILVADIVGYSRLAGADEVRTLSRLITLASVIESILPVCPWGRSGKSAFPDLAGRSRL